MIYNYAKHKLPEAITIKPIVYIDLLFLTNFLINSITLYCASLFIKRNISLLRTALTAAALSLYSCVMFFPNLSFLYSFVFKILIFVASTLIAFPSRKWQVVLKNSLVAFTVNAIFGGIIFALIFLTDFGGNIGAAISNGEIYLNISSSALIISVIPAYFFAYVISLIRKQNLKQSPYITDMTIFFENKNINIRAFGDTGCQLREPSSESFAIIINQSCAKKLLPDVFMKALLCNSPEFPEEYVKKYRMLPFYTVGNAHGILPAFVADRIIINSTELKSYTVAISKHKLCENRQFDAIFNPTILVTPKDAPKETLAM